jgi:hypothetical protein
MKEMEYLKRRAMEKTDNEKSLGPQERDPATPKLKVINLFGAPGMGKSATRSGLFWLMKVKGMSVEEVSEYAKFLVLSGREWQLKRDQLSVMASQHHKMLILDGVYDYAVTDSPLMLASFYAPPGTPKSFGMMCEEYAASYENINFFLTRDLSKGFETRGRVHGKEDSMRIEGEQKSFLAKLGYEWHDIELGDDTPWALLDKLQKLYPGSVPKRGPMRPQSHPEQEPALVSKRGTRLR